jgi:formylglycine-generating enzyme required for sulfatase activity
MGSWQQREHYLALDRQAQDAAFGVIPVILPNADPALGFLSLNTWVDLRNGVDDAASMDLLAAAVRGQSPAELLERTRKAAAAICPYRGLEVFREEDAPFFFGREAFTEDLREAVAAQSGLIPSLRRPNGDTVWEVVTLVPGQQPLHALAGALLPLLEPEMTETDQLVELNKQAGHLAKGDLRLHQVISRVLEKQPGTDRLLLVVDQWEELYTHEAADEKSKAQHKRDITRFIDELLAATDAAPVTVVLTLRADFYGEALLHRELADRLRGAVVNLGPMTREELEQAVTQPAQKVSLDFDTGLVDRLLDDVGDEPGNLPLMEFALKALWEARRGNRLLYNTYKAMDGVKGAIAKRAETVYAKLSATQQKTAEHVFTKLVRPGDETGDTRRRAELREFDLAGQALINTLAGPQARLLITGRDTGTNQETVEVAHEALIREWDELQTWVLKVRQQLKDQALMEDLARNWEDHGGGLAAGRQLRDFQRAGAPTEQAKRFLKASHAHRLKTRLSILLSTTVLLGGLVGFVWWSDELGLSAHKGAELLLHRAGLYQPAWIPEMVTIEPGSFQMGSPNPKGSSADPDADSNEFPQHTVTFEKAFKIGKYEVTFEQYCASTRRPCPAPKWGRGKQPVINVAWDDARDYAAWLTEITGQAYRLPTEAEWEYVARAGRSGRYWWCDDEEPNCAVKPDVANCISCESTKGVEGVGEGTVPVDSFAANAFGLHDTAGNVWEWVQDCWHDSYEGKNRPDDGSAWEEADGDDCGRRVIRGGAWYDRPRFLRSANRYGGDTGLRNGNLGFRLAQDP